ncbi:glycosyl hydrolase 115 family protein [Pontiellaceae bacterium B12227]|nr:glycosyl hydrolase 115 family protein [Pontiellaceae bacterium B12227]
MRICRTLIVAVTMFAIGTCATSAAVRINGDTPWVVMEADFENPAIQEAIRDAERDWYKVFGYPPVIFKNDTRSSWTGPVVLFGSANNTKRLIDSQLPEGAEQHRLFFGKVKQNNAIIATGSDTRGTIFAIYTFCERVLGIDPMYVFTDHVPKKHREITLSRSMEFVSKTPTFENRGWFINDEELHDGMHRDPLGGNVISMEWMDRIIETLLRCKGNMLIPESSPFPDATVYDLCKRRDVIITFHHIDPCGINMMHWPENVPFSYITHKEILEDAWRKSVKVLADKKVAWIVGFRGESDGAFWNSDPAAPKDDQGRADVISEAMHKQVEIIREFDPDATIVAALWNELGAFYNKGILKVPEGICKMFADDGRGYMRDKGDGSDLDEGDGLYYHVQMMMNTQNRTSEMVPPARIYKELRRYVERGATKYAIINVSGIRPAVMSVEAIMDFLWDAEPTLSQEPEAAMTDYLNAWHAKTYGPQLAEQLTELRLQYYQIPYMREYMPNPHRWSGARGEHLMHYQIQELLKRYGKSIRKGEDIAAIDQFAERFRQATAPLAETAEYIPVLWEATKQLEKEIPVDRRCFYQAHFTYQVAVHMYSSRALAIVTDAVSQYLTDRDPQAFATRIAPAVDEIEKVIHEAHKAEYGIWDTMFMHVRLMDIWRTRLMLKQTIAEIEGKPFTSSYRGYMNGSFWGSAQAYMDHGDGVFPYFYKSSGRGLEVIESGEIEAIEKQKLDAKRQTQSKAALEAAPITEIRFNSDLEYIVVPNGLKKGALIWTDRKYRAQSIPPELEGATYIQTPMVDRSNEKNDLIAFTLKKDATVYIALKEGEDRPKWLADWEKTDGLLNASNKLICYRRNFSRGGSVVLGGSGGASCMYSVAIKEK